MAQSKKPQENNERVVDDVFEEMSVSFCRKTIES